MIGFPPFNRLVRLVFRSPNQNQASACAEQASILLEQICGSNAEVIGPAECPVFKISQNFRFQILLRSQNITVLQKAASALLNNYTHPQSVYIECDIDPLSLM